LALLGLTACSPSRVIESWRVLHDVAADGGPSRLKEITPQPKRTAIAYRIADRPYQGDLYRPGEASRAALVLVPGAAPEGRDHPRLIAFAETLARARFTVLVPDIESLRALRVGPNDVRHIADAVRYLNEARAAEETSGPIGIAAISYAAGPAVLAALQPDVRDDVRFVLAIGGYYDMEAVVTFFTTGGFREDATGPWQHGTPNPYGKWLFLHANTHRLDDPRDRVLMTAMAERKWRDPDTDIADLVEKLGPDGRVVHAVLTNTDPAAAAALIAGLPRAIRDDMAALDVERHDLSRLRARLILIHGRDDAIIPFSESQALAAAVPPGQVSLIVVRNLAHVELGPGGLLDGLRLWRAVYRLLEERDADPVSSRGVAPRQ
jgi:pimeloyl-ACP methyl ester carboxylesterase